MSIVKASLTPTLLETQFHQMMKRTIHHGEDHKSFFHELDSKMTNLNSSLKHSSNIHQSEKKNLEEDSFHHKDNFSPVHKGHHEKNPPTEIKTTKENSKPSSKSSAVNEGVKSHENEEKKIDSDEERNSEENDSDIESRHVTTSHEALLSSAGQAISSRMGFNNSFSNTSDPDSSTPYATSVAPATSTTIKTSPLPQDTDKEEPLLKISSFSFSESLGEEDISISKSNEGSSQGVMSSKESLVDPTAVDAKENILMRTASTVSRESVHAPVAEANRLSNFLHELQANVTRFVAGNGGKMAFDLKNVGGNLDGGAHVSLEIIPDPFHIRVQFNTDHAGVFKFLDSQKEALQTSLATQFTGQVFDIKNQFTPQRSSQHFGSEGEHPREDIASFDQENRGHENARHKNG